MNQIKIIKIIMFFSVIFILSSCLNSNHCGNEIIDSLEECDEGENNTFSCNATYDTSCEFCDTSCNLVEINGGYCGDNKLNGNEECDEGENNNHECEAEYGETCSYCNYACKIVEIQGEHCGDNKLNGNEICDGVNYKRRYNGRHYCNFIHTDIGTAKCDENCIIDYSDCKFSDGTSREEYYFSPNKVLKVYNAKGIIVYGEKSTYFVECSVSDQHNVRIVAVNINLGDFTEEHSHPAATACGKTCVIDTLELSLEDYGDDYCIIKLIEEK